MKLVKVTWLDTNETSDSGWVSLEEAKENGDVTIDSYEPEKEVMTLMQTKLNLKRMTYLVELNAFLVDV